MAPERIRGKDPTMHASYMLNHRAICAFHRIGCGPMHMEQVAAWLDHPWKSMGHCWKMTEEVLGEILTEVAKVSIEAAQEVERMMTLLKRKNVLRDNHGNIGIGGSLDMHWPGRGSGVLYNSDSGASYLMGIFCHLIIAAWVFAKVVKYAMSL